MIKDIKTYAAGTIFKGFPLLIKTARKTFTDANDQTWQEVVFMDASGEILGHILLDADKGNVPWKSKTNLCIMDGIIQDTDERKKQAVKIVVTECFDAATPLSYDQSQDMQAEDWRRMREEEIKGKIRHGLVCADKSAGKVPNKKDILEWQEFILTGE